MTWLIRMAGVSDLAVAWSREDRWIDLPAVRYGSKGPLSLLVPARSVRQSTQRGVCEPPACQSAG